MKIKLLITAMLLLGMMFTSCNLGSNQPEDPLIVSQPNRIEKEDPGEYPDVPPLQLWEVQLQFVKHDTLSFGNFKPKIITHYDSAGPFLVKSKRRPTVESLAGPLSYKTPPKYAIDKLTYLQRLK
jgi:hypothetical protein